ncbi:MAG: hypothetical protein ACRDMA_10355 [Solirubrobacterales bacterium]
MSKVVAYIPLAIYLIAASIVINVIENEWGLSSGVLLAATFAIIAVGGFLMPSRPYRRIH